MPFFYRTLFFFILFLVSGILQALPVSVKHLPYRDQFPSSSFTRVIQDKDGYIWFGTMDGLCRYDGYRIKVFRSDFNTPDILVNNEITFVAEDNNNVIWIGTKTGISLLDRNTFSIRPFNHPEVSNLPIKFILPTSGGDVWIGAENIVYRYNPTKDVLESLSGSALPYAGINSMYEDSYGDVWILYWGMGLYKYKKDGTVVSYPTIGKRNNPFKIYQDKDKQFWLCTWGDGVHRFYPNNNQGDMYEQQLVYKSEKSETEDTFYGIMQDDKMNYIWLMSYSGVYALDPSADTHNKQVDISSLFAKSNKIFSEMMKDQSGNIWIAGFSEGGMFLGFDDAAVYNLPMKGIKQMNLTPNITAVTKLDKSTLLLNQNRIGLCFYDLKTDKVESFRSFKNLKDLSYLSNVSQIKQMSNGEIWIGAAESSLFSVITMKDGQPQVQKTYDLNTINSNFLNFGIKCILEDRKKNIWIAGDKYLYVKPYYSTQIELVDAGIANIEKIVEDSGGQIWLTSNTNGIYKVDFNYNTQVKDFVIVNFNKSNSRILSNENITIDIDADDNLWIGNLKGSVMKYSSSDKTFTDYTKLCGLTGEAIQDICIDSQNNMWISTNRKVVKYNEKNRSVREFSMLDDIVVNSFLAHSCFYDKKGEEIYFGGNNGICVFPVNNAGNNVLSKNTNILISDIKVQGKSILAGDENNYFHPISKKVNIDASSKNIEIDFTTLNYNHPDKVHYAYKMDGVDEDWVYTDRQFASYNQLKNGKNIFYVKATDESRIWSDEIEMIEIYKKAPFYQTNLAYFFYLLFVVACMYIAFRITRNRIRLQQKLHFARIDKAKSEELTQIKLSYFTNISHELLTPLTIISCLIDDIETEPNKKNYQLGMMRSNVNRLRRLLQQILDFRKVESGNMALRVLNGDISMLIRDICYNSFGLMFENKNIQFRYESAPQNITGYFDADKIDKIIYNLLSNAIKFTPEEGHVSVCLSTESQESDIYILIKVADDGVGIKPEEQQKIFQRFFNNKNISASQTNGIGLSLTKELVELHHGTIHLESEKDKGTVFTVAIPINESAYNKLEKEAVYAVMFDDTEDITNNTNEFAEGDNQEKEKVTILLVEDNEEILYTLKRILQKQYTILTATNGELALNMLKVNDIDMIVSDVIMPEMDGMEFCKIVKNDIETSHIPIILLTAKTSVSDRIDCYDAGADAYISKPFDIKVLEARINNFLLKKKEKQSAFKENVDINISTLEYSSSDESFLNEAIRIIEKYLDNSEFSLDDFAREMNLSKSSLYRKLKTLTGLSPSEFIRNIRLKHACRLLKDVLVSITTVAYEVGFTDPRYFSTSFKNAFNITPSDYQKLHNEKKEIQ